MFCMKVLLNASGNTVLFSLTCDSRILLNELEMELMTDTF